MLLLQATHFLSLVWSEQISSVIRQKDESQYGGNKKTKHIKFNMLCFITSILRFTLLPYYQRYGILSLRAVLFCHYKNRQNYLKSFKYVFYLKMPERVTFFYNI